MSKYCIYCLINYEFFYVETVSKSVGVMTTTIVSMSVTRSDSAKRQAQSGNSDGNFRELNL